MIQNMIELLLKICLKIWMTSGVALVTGFLVVASVKFLIGLWGGGK